VDAGVSVSDNETWSRGVFAPVVGQGVRRAMQKIGACFNEVRRRVGAISFSTHSVTIHAIIDVNGVNPLAVAFP
jgi:hypothetical protein